MSSVIELMLINVSVDELGCMVGAILPSSSWSIDSLRRVIKFLLLVSIQRDSPITPLSTDRYPKRAL